MNLVEIRLIHITKGSRIYLVCSTVLGTYIYIPTKTSRKKILQFSSIINILLLAQLYKNKGVSEQIHEHRNIKGSNIKISLTYRYKH